MKLYNGNAQAFVYNIVNFEVRCGYEIRDREKLELNAKYVITF